MPPSDAFTVPRDPRAVRIELTRTWLLFVLDMVISVRDLVGLARANGVRLGVLDLVVFGLFRRPLVVSAATVRPLGLDRIHAELDRARATIP